jgi:hypothetical protein
MYANAALSMSHIFLESRTTADPVSARLQPLSNITLDLRTTRSRRFPNLTHSRPLHPLKLFRATASRLRLHNPTHLGPNPKPLLAHPTRQRRSPLRPSILAIRFLPCSRRQNSRPLRSRKTRSQRRSHRRAGFRHERYRVERESHAGESGRCCRKRRLTSRDV